MAAFVSQHKQQTRNLGDNERARLSSLQLHLLSPHETGNATTKTIFLCMRAQPDFLAEKFASERISGFENFLEVSSAKVEATVTIGRII